MPSTSPPGGPAAAAAAPRGVAGFWARYKRWVVPAFGLLVLAMLLSHAHKIDWAGAWHALKQYKLSLLAGVLGLALASHALYGCFDLIGRHHTRHKLGVLRTWAIALASYAFNLNLGSLVGGVAMRARLYARAGLDEATVAQVVGVSLATNWLGYGLLAGTLFAAGMIAPPEQAHMTASTFRLLGGGMVLLAAAYVAWCFSSKGRTWQFRGRKVRLPSGPLALLQLLVSACNWALMGGAMYLLLGGDVSYGMTLGVLMAAAVVGVVTPIPAGLGVLEAVYLALLSGDVPQGKLMGAVLAYRALYYLLPLASGIVIYALLERYASQHPATEPGPSAPAQDDPAAEPAAQQPAA